MHIIDSPIDDELRTPLQLSVCSNLVREAGIGDSDEGSAPQRRSLDLFVDNTVEQFLQFAAVRITILQLHIHIHNHIDRIDPGDVDYLVEPSQQVDLIDPQRHQM